MWIIEIINFSSVFLLLSVIAYFQNKYLSIHVSRKPLLKSPRKRKLLASTVVFCLGFLYRAVMNILKPLLGDNERHLNTIDDLET